MLSKSKILVAVLCGGSFAVGFIATPIYNSVVNWDYSNMTDSAHVNSSGIDIVQMNTPSEGYHVWISPKGNLYMGVWQNGILCNGILITDKSVYEGEMLNLSPHGYGTMYYNNGNIYRGNWSAGNKEGIGLKHNRDGSMYFGHWRAGLFNAPKNVEHKVEDRVYGIDVSKYQHHSSVKWKELALYSDTYGEVYAYPTEEHSYMQPVTFAFIKATQGICQDPYYQHHIENARKHHVIVGAYHFFTIGDDITAQISNFTQHVKLFKGDLPPVLDLESESPDEKVYIAKLRKYGVKRMQDEAIQWLTEIEAYYGIKPIIYTSEVWKKNFLSDSRFNSYEFWISRYYNVKPSKEFQWVFWQRTCKAQPRGYNGAVDINVFNGSFSRFMEYRKSLYEQR